MTKKELLAHWEKLQPNQNPFKVMSSMSSRKRGSSYGCDGIRIDGSPQFIDAVLSCLKPLLAGENGVTRLACSRSVVTQSEGYKAGENAYEGAEVCYIRLQERSVTAKEAAALSMLTRAIFG
jgi:hypothetical protein